MEKQFEGPLAAVDSTLLVWELGVWGLGKGRRTSSCQSTYSCPEGLLVIENKGTGVQLRAAHQGPTAHFRLLNESIVYALPSKLASRFLWPRSQARSRQMLIGHRLLESLLWLAFRVLPLLPLL